MDKAYYVYILTSERYGTLYVGVNIGKTYTTDSLNRRPMDFRSHGNDSLA